MLRAFFKDSIIYAIPAIISRGLSLFLVPLYTQVLSPADYGSLDLFTVFASIVNLTIALEVSQGVARFYAEELNADHRVAYASSALWFTVTCHTVFALIMLAFTNNLSVFIMGRPDLQDEFRVGVFYIWISSIFYLIQNQFRWELRSRHYALVSLIMAFVTAGMSLWLTLKLSLGLFGLLVGMVSGCGVASILGLWFLRKTFRVCFSFVRLRTMLAFSIPLVFSSIGVWISLYIDRLMINQFMSVDDVGLYGIAYRLAGIAGLVMVGFQGALTPLIYTHHNEQGTPKHLARIFRFFLFFALLMFLGLTLFSKDIFNIFTSPEFYAGSDIMIYLVPAVFLSNMYIFAPGIAIEKRTNLYIWINLAGALVNIIMNWALIPVWGLEGAAVATLLAYLTVFSIHMIFSQKIYPIPHDWRTIIVSVVVAILLASLVPLLSSADWLRWIGGGVVLLLFSLFGVVVGLIKYQEMRNIILLVKSYFKSTALYLANFLR